MSSGRVTVGIGIALLGLLGGAVAVVGTAEGADAAPATEVKVVNGAETPALAVPITAPAPLPVTGSLAVTVGGSEPLLVQDVSSGVQPVHVGSGSGELTIASGQLAAFTTFQVPAGKRLVIEHFSGRLILPAGQLSRGATIDTRTVTLDGTATTQRSHFDFEPDANYFFVNDLVKRYADTGTAVQVTVFRNATAGSGSFRWSLSGYLVDV
jgi:hypothetical protein